MNKRIKNLVGKIGSILPDKLYLSLLYFIKMGKIMHWKNPKSFTEKLQWIKVYDRNPAYSRLVDKYEMKKYVDEKLGEGYTVPTIGLWDSVSEINENKLPEKFVIKCTHDSGSNIICKDKSSVDFSGVKKHLDFCLKNNLFYLSREWPYKNVKPRIIAEKLLEDETQESLTEYKLFCFDGVVRIVLICKGVAHSNGRTNDFCDVELKRLPFTSLFPNSKGEIIKPKCYEKLLECASILSKGIPFVRVDSYIVNDQIYFGELTFFHNSGLRRYEPNEWDIILGDWLQLPKK